jgi:uncharacterized protein YndB with AHSA1/START domain
MREHHLEARFVANAPAEVIWEALADTVSWPTWSPTDSADLEREGWPERESVGAVRVFRTGRFTVREQVVEFQRNRRLVYRMLSGMPVRDYVAEVSLTPGSDRPATDLVWRSNWRPLIPGTAILLRPLLQGILDRWGAALVAHAERVSAARG